LIGVFSRDAKGGRMILDEMRRELKRNVDPAYKKSLSRFFKEGQEVNYLGVRTPVVRKISKKYFVQVKGVGKEELFKLCERILEKGYGEEQGIAFGWVSRFHEHFEQSDFRRFSSWLERFVKNWAHCDGYCLGVLGPFIRLYPHFLPDVKRWTASKNRWFRRASAVLMIHLMQEKKYLKDAFEISDLLMMDEDDLVQKGYGWLLKEASNRYQKEVFTYVMKHKDMMPRTALRYAIEKMPERLKKRAMERKT
jgi:3-methyladenine DNA glycosylase AlkD